MIRQRTQRGSLAALGFIGMIPLLIALGAYAIDLMHVNSTKGELQRSCDAAALAGAARLFDYDTDNPKGDSATKAAQAILRVNFCDGRVLDDRDPEITDQITFPAIPVNGVGGQVKVDAQIQIHGMFSKIFGSMTQMVSASATAGSNGNVNQAFAGQLFPIAVALNQPDPSGNKLSSLGIGGTFTIVFGPSGSDDAGWTTLNVGGGANQIKKAIDFYKNPSKTGGSAVKVTDSIDLKNGEIASAISAASAYVGKTVVMPVIDTSTFNGSSTVRGFVGMTIISVDATGNPKTIVCKINNAELNGTTDPSVPVYDSSATNAGTFFPGKQVSTPKLVL
jgi:Flp pilus assembly protein TadG